MDAAQEKEIEALKAKLKAAEATIAELSSTQSPSLFGRQWHADVEGEQAIESSRFPLFRKVQSDISKSYLDYIESKKGVSDRPSVEQLFSKYDADRSGMLDIAEFRAMVKEMDLPVDLSVPDFGAMAEDAAKSAETLVSDAAKSAETLVSDTAKSAETLVSGTARSADGLAKSVLGGVNSLAKGVNDLAVSAGVPGATARVPVTLVGGCGSGY